MRPALAALKKFPAIGTPGAEKVLLFTRTAPLLALESNGLRVLLRLGVAPEGKGYDASYRAVRDALAGEITGRACEWLIRAHQLLRRHGQELCTRSHPRCDACPLEATCAWPRRAR